MTCSGNKMAPCRVRCKIFLIESDFTDRMSTFYVVQKLRLASPHNLSVLMSYHNGHVAAFFFGDFQKFHIIPATDSYTCLLQYLPTA